MAKYSNWYLSTHFQECKRTPNDLPKTLYALTTAWSNIVDLNVTTLDENSYLIKFTTYEKV